MGFFDNLKGKADNLKGKATDLAQAGVAQSKRLAEIAKLKTSNMAEEDTIKKAYIELGKLYYAEKGLTPEGAYAAACEKITAAKAAIEANNDRIAELKDAADDSEVEIVAEAHVVTADDADEVTPDDFVDEIKEVTEEAKEVISEVASEVKEAVSEAKDEVKDLF